MSDLVRQALKNKLRQIRMDLNEQELESVLDDLMLEQDRLKRIEHHVLVEENSLLKSQNAALKAQSKNKFSATENQTIAFQLGKLILDGMKKKKKLLDMPGSLFGLYRQSLQRKSNQGNELNYLEGLIHYHATRHKPQQVPQHSLESFDFDAKNTAFGDFSLEHNVVDTVKATDSVIENEITVKTDRLKIAGIMDEFTYLCFSPEADLLQLTPDNWKKELQLFQPDMIFIESAWQGKDSLWKQKVSQFGEEIQDLLKYCHKNKIRSMFWNKEDPVHFGTFIEVAKNVDVVFTTDIDCISKYKAQVGHDNVYLLPFAAQPKTHNPIELYQRKQAFNFAGSFYLKYPERQRDFITLTDVALSTSGLEIYDRNYDKPHPHYTFPDRFKPYILGRLAPEEIDKAYKGYLYGINMNTIKQSQSMFARRVFEMLASNTIVVSNYSRGVRNFFGDLVVCSDNRTELIRQLNEINKSKLTQKKFRLAGLRKVLSEHTYAHRISYITEKLNIKLPKAKHSIAVLAIAKDDLEYKNIIDNFNSQIFENKQLFVLNQENSLGQNEYVYRSVEGIIDCLAEFSHIACFDSKSFYGKHYLYDMQLSLAYTQYLEVDAITKGNYFSLDDTTQSLKFHKDVTSYTAVSGIDLSRSMLHNKSDAMQFIKAFLEGRTQQNDIRAFSIDELNFVADLPRDHSLVGLADDVIDDNSTVKDLGVDLFKQVLPLAENIKSDAQYIAYPIAEYYKNNQQKYPEIQVERRGLQLRFKSNKKLQRNKHRSMMSDLIEIPEDMTQIALQGLVPISGLASMIFDFYDGSKQKLQHFELKGEKVLDSKVFVIPTHAKFVKLHVRLQGEALLELQNTLIVFSRNEGESEKKYTDSSIVTLSSKVIGDLVIHPKSNMVRIASQGGKLKIKSTLPQDKHAYFYLSKIFTREELNLVLNSEFELIEKHDCQDFRIVFEFQDENKQKIAHTISGTVGKHAMAIPMECKYIRLGFKVVGSGLIEIAELRLGTIKEAVNHLIVKTDTLVLAKQYPAYDDLYKYGFLHTRLKAYKDAGKLVTMYRVNNDPAEFGFREFQGIDVISYDLTLLDKELASGKYRKIVVHILDKYMWDVLKKYQNDLDIVIWVHGSEAQIWERRAYEAQRLSKDEVARQKKLSEGRKVFWQNLIASKSDKVRLVFVSQYALNEFKTDLNVSLKDSDVNVINNFIDGGVFNYQKKNPELRKKILSIRPYSSLTYANDLTVKTILELSKLPVFSELEFMLVGDGELFDNTVEPLRNFDNVKLHKGFLTHQEISQLHKEYGIFLVPTRMDTQGVSRDEAMSSGLVAITTNVAAIPEFVDSDCAMIVNAEDYKAMAQKIVSLINNEDEFIRLSQAGHYRVARERSFDNTIVRELSLI